MIFLKIKPNLKLALDSSIFETASRAAFNETNYNQVSELSVVITDNVQMQKLNKKFRGIDAVTDVLSFPSCEIDPETGINYLGDIIISYPQAFEQASRAGHSVDTELQLLTVHGILHLIGFDHYDKDEKERMWKIQNAALEELGLPKITITGDEI